MNETRNFLSTEQRQDLMPPCESRHRSGARPAEWIVWVECVFCGQVAHLLCDDHRKRLDAKPGALWVHPPCGTPDCVYLASETRPLAS